MSDEELRRLRDDRLREQDRLRQEQGLATDEAKKIGRALRTLGQALEESPELVRASLGSGEILLADSHWIFPTRQIPTLGEIERLTEGIRARANRLPELSRLLG